MLSLLCTDYSLYTLLPRGGRILLQTRRTHEENCGARAFRRKLSSRDTALSIAPTRHLGNLQRTLCNCTLTCTPFFGTILLEPFFMGTRPGYTQF